MIKYQIGLEGSKLVKQEVNIALNKIIHKY